MFETPDTAPSAPLASKRRRASWSSLRLFDTFTVVPPFLWLVSIERERPLGAEAVAHTALHVSVSLAGEAKAPQKSLAGREFP